MKRPHQSKHWPLSFYQYPPRSFCQWSCSSSDGSACETMERALARVSSRIGAVHDPASPSHDRGYAGPQPRTAHPALVSAANLPVRPSLRQVARAARTRPHPNLPDPSEPGQAALGQFHARGRRRHPFPLQGHAQARSSTRSRSSATGASTLSFRPAASRSGFPWCSAATRSAGSSMPSTC